MRNIYTTLYIRYIYEISHKEYIIWFFAWKQSTWKSENWETNEYSRSKGY